ncbi:bifunctional phosphoribosyl-AMP cyclohydrolase/phosphoribosyl-ATP pyrophosphatase [Paenibacillus selenitireducens]|uniref:Histidine biosynthesis bifunctional protein HisIE n=1 Tax=Paenibacillus selenitireducens TaxID=1324314 RepID=A0A1T2X910_9BACL|nr:bifunctional phosphoribosyl-AMP cyclohydrolase/phosphoribosyl-ATP diphosphatase HisIE [Paenibacillus selenitireducens]OPA76322.1 bifunctional phosphoribosyl-AMP cyclohydrolase/phosphoribosyl-ATP pyrophosphatase [Paenibacillus selenitireducens]
MTLEQLSAQLKWDAAGLIPAVVQDYSSKEVLMLAYMNRESLQLSVESGETWFWSRSRQELWHKGATSGHTQHIVSMQYDCDGDTLLVRVDQQGPACHTGKYSCFFNDIPTSEQAGASREASGSDRFAVLSKLDATIAERYAERPEGAYTTYLFEKGLDKILKKIGEESAEVLIAAKNNDREELRAEAGDLIYHLMVLLRQQNMPIDEVLQVLENRHYTSDIKNKTK